MRNLTKCWSIVIGVTMCLVTISAQFHGASAQEAKDIVAEAQKITNDKTPFKIELWTEEGKSAYNVGDTINFLFKTDRDCYVTLIDIGTSGKVTKLFPNAWNSSNAVKAGQVYRIPPAAGNFRFRIDPPAGRDFVKAIATLDPLQCVNTAQVSKKGNFLEFRKPVLAIKDIAMELAAQDSKRWAETELSITIAGSAPVAVTQAVEPFTITVTTDKPVYQIGEQISFTFQSNKDCHLTLVDIGSSGQVRIIFPNQYSQDNRIKANQLYRIPPVGAAAQFAYRVMGPPGFNTIKAVATLDPCQQCCCSASFGQAVYPIVGTKDKVLKDIEVGLATLQPTHHSEADIRIEIKGQTSKGWDEFRKAKEKAEKSKLVAKGRTKPRLIRRDIIIEQLSRTPQQPSTGVGTQSPITGTSQVGVAYAPPQPGVVIFASDSILFHYGSARIKEWSYPQLMEIAYALNDPALVNIPLFYVDGHCCDIGSDANNCRLSWDRAREVVNFLTTVGRVNPARLRPRGFGERSPAYPNTSEFFRSQNRRVVLKSGVVTFPMDEALLCRGWADWRGDYGGSWDYARSYDRYRETAQEESVEPEKIDVEGDWIKEKRKGRTGPFNTMTAPGRSPSQVQGRPAPRGFRRIEVRPGAGIVPKHFNQSEGK